MVAVELFRRYGKENVYYLNADKEIDFIVPDEKVAIQVSYSIKEESTYSTERALVPVPSGRYVRYHASAPHGTNRPIQRYHLGDILN